MEDDTTVAVRSNSLSGQQQQHHPADPLHPPDPLHPDPVKSSPSSSSLCTTKGLKTFKRLFLFFSMIVLMLASAVVLALTATGLLQVENEEQIECSLEKDVAELEKYDASYLTLGFATLALSIIGLLGVWKKNNCILVLFVLGMSILSITMVVLKWKARNQEQEDFKQSYLALLPLSNGTARPCSRLSNVHNWQAKFKCCGLINGYQDWEFAVPDSCLCEPDEGDALCAQVSNSTSESTNKRAGYYVQPCLPLVLPHVGTSILNSSPYVITIWVAIVLQVVDLLYVLHREAAQRRYRSQRVPVVYLRMRPNSKAHHHHLNGGDAVESRRASDVEAQEGEGEEDESCYYENNECPMLLVTMEELEKMVVFQPPPYTAVLKCHEPNEFVSKPFYVVHVPPDAPLPHGAPRLIEGLDWAQMTPLPQLDNGHRVFLLPYPPAVNFCQDFS